MNDDLRSEVRGRQLYARHADMHRAGQPDALVLRDKMDATAGPTVNDDRLKLYSVGSRWIDITNDKEYVCLDNSVGAAIWAERAASGMAGHSAVTLAADAEVLLGLSGQQLTLDPQNANTVFAGPAAAPAADPTFRALVAADVPTHASTHNAGGGDALAIDAVAGTGSLRTLGTGATQAAVGNHTHAGGSAHTIKEDGTPLTARTGLNFGTGLTASDDAVNDETDVVLAAHASSHNAGGGDALAADQAAATASLRTLGAGASQAAAGNHTHAGGGVSMAQVWALI